MSSTFVAVALLLSAVSALKVGTEMKKITLISDIHYDPLYGTPQCFGPCSNSSYSTITGTSGCDAPYGLVSAALNDALSPERGAEYVLMTGDWVRHGMGEVPWAMVPAFETVASLLSNFSGHAVALPNIAGALGNNDFVPDYHFNVSARPHPLLQNLTDVLQRKDVLAEGEAASFRQCGYYAREVKNTTLTLIVLNTLVWSTALTPPLASGNTDPCGQLVFLRTALEAARAKGRRVYVLSHIPPIINLFGVLSGDAIATAGYWKPEFRDAYMALVATYSSTIAVQLFGHTHQFSFLAELSLDVPLFVVPSITPVFGNNPSYLEAVVDNETWSIHELQQRYQLPNGTWVDGERIDRVLNPKSEGNMTTFALHEAALNLVVDNDMWDRFRLIHGGGLRMATVLDDGCEALCRRIVSCSMLYAEPEVVERCTVVEPPQLLTQSVSVGVIFVTVVATLLTLASTVYLIKHIPEINADKKK